jgi:putative ABC transport system ATP-binding protein
MTNKIIKLTKVNKSYFIGEPNELQVLHDIDLCVYEGEFLSIIGASGSGKSTMMNIIGALDRPTSGSYDLNGLDITAAKDAKLSKIRNQKIGFVFQTYNLIPRATALRNVEMPLIYAEVSSAIRRKKAKELLELVDMEDRMMHKPDELSGGQKQRVAIARAMANDPDIILADEPTGALDSKTGKLIMDIFHRLNREQGKTIILITHEHELAESTDRQITLKDGEIISEEIHNSKKYDANKKTASSSTNIDTKEILI